MTWFRTDDAWWRSKKVLGRRLSLAARGLWITAGSWICDELTDGHFTADELEAFAPVATPATLRKLAAELVHAGLWEVTPTGWHHHDWTDYQPTRTQVEAKREAWRARQQRSRGTPAVTPISHAVSRRDTR